MGGFDPNVDYGHQPGFYDIDHLRKQSVAKSVENSPLRYSILRSRAPRFTSSISSTPFGVYDTDKGPTKSLVSSARDCRRFYSSSFDSAVPRFPRPRSGGAVDAFYDPTRTKTMGPNSIEKALETTAIDYAIHRSKYKRFEAKKTSEAPDAMYDTEYGSKQSLYNAMLNSPIKYGNVLAGTAHKMSLNNGNDTVHQTVFYDAKRMQDISVSPALDNHPLSSLMSCTPRFGGQRLQGYGLGSTYRPETDTKAWSKDVTISKAEYLRPQYLPKSYMAKPGELNKSGKH